MSLFPRTVHAGDLQRIRCLMLSGQGGALGRAKRARLASEDSLRLAGADLVGHCEEFMTSLEGEPQFEKLSVIADAICEETEDDCLNAIVDLGFLEFLRSGLQIGEAAGLLAISKVCRRWSLVDSRLGFALFSKAMNRICDVVMGVCQFGSDFVVGEVCENFILGVHNVIIGGYELEPAELERVLRLNVEGYSVFGVMANAMHANCLLTGVIANQCTEELEEGAIMEMTKALLGAIRNDYEGQMFVGPVGVAAMSSLFHVITKPEHQRFVVTPLFLQDVLPRYLRNFDVSHRRCAYSVFCRLATSPDEGIRSSTLTLVPLHVIAEMFRNGSDEDKVAFCNTIACVINENPEHMFLFYENEIVETISIFATSEVFAVKQSAMSCVCKIFAESDYAAQWRFMKAILPNLEDFLAYSPEEFSPLIFQVLERIDKMPARERQYYISRVSHLIDALTPTNEEDEALLRKLAEITDQITHQTDTETRF